MLSVRAVYVLKPLQLWGEGYDDFRDRCEITGSGSRKIGEGDRMMAIVRSNTTDGYRTRTPFAEGEIIDSPRAPAIMVINSIVSTGFARCI